MRRLLTGGIKAILAVAALSTAAHWVMRVQREPTASSRVLADLADPVTTGSITPRKLDAIPAVLTEPDVTKGLDQRRLSELFAGTASDKAKVQKAVARR
ncbi:hypothetical protein [Methylobacterium sp. J-068]|uniref:hypothetical protein n=1 Tax=Methylobacterium sp. J-068 TaxID=2836649 RepID=UPI001FB8C557|nr:hypothetical protein [Methylobacterium sp. J-068]MCJ2033907.1 hypothetical protein [Methylobacterium sp. J-068]